MQLWQLLMKIFRIAQYNCLSLKQVGRSDEVADAVDVVDVADADRVVDVVNAVEATDVVATSSSPQGFSEAV